MYQDSGKTIKFVAKVAAILGVLLSLILSIILCAVLIGVHPALAIAVFVLSLCGGCLVAWLLGLFMHAYGEMTDRLISIEEILYDRLANDSDDCAD